MSATAGFSPAADQGIDVLIEDVPRPAPLLAVAGMAWLAAAVFVVAWPDAQEVERTDLLGSLEAAGGGVFLVLWLLGWVVPPVARAAGYWAPWMLALAVWLTAWETVTAKLDYLPLPFFCSPQAFLEVFTDDYARLFDCLWRSMLLHTKGYAIGSFLGFISGVALGMSVRIGYWVHPVLRLIGPLPATAWIPLAFFLFPSSASASVFLIGLALVSHHGADLVGRFGCQTGVLRRGSHPRRQPALPGAESGHSGGASACVRWSVHGPRLLFRRAGGGRDVGREVGSRLVPAMGAGLGRLRQHVCRSFRHGAAVLFANHPVVPGA